MVNSCIRKMSRVLLPVISFSLLLMLKGVINFYIIASGRERGKDER